MKVRLLLNDPQNSYRGLMLVTRALLSNDSEQHGRLLHSWFLEGFVLVESKKKMMLCSFSKLRETPFRRKIVSR